MLDTQKVANERRRNAAVRRGDLLGRWPSVTAIGGTAAAVIIPPTVDLITPTPESMQQAWSGTTRWLQYLSTICA